MSIRDALLPPCRIGPRTLLLGPPRMSAHHHVFWPTISPGMSLCRCGATDPPSVPRVTSEEAAEKIAPKVGSLQRRVYECIEQHGPCTDEQICKHTGMNPSTERPRRIELVELGKLRDSGKVGLTESKRRAVLWEVAS